MNAFYINHLDFFLLLRGVLQNTNFLACFLGGRGEDLRGRGLCKFSIIKYKSSVKVFFLEL